jgi:hypothetical protein
MRRWPGSSRNGPSSERRRRLGEPDVFNERSGTVIAMALTSQTPRAGFPLTLEMTAVKAARCSCIDDETVAQQAAQLRVASAERLRDTVVNALSRLHGILDSDQRERLAYLIRTGTLTL